MEYQKLAKIKLERAAKMIENFDDMTEGDMRNFFICLLRSIDFVPQQSYNRSYLYSKITSILDMDIKKYGVIFKAMNWKGSQFIKKDDMQGLVTDVSALLQ